jgi:predicted DNA-binding transcriptional regulator AlpA
MKLTTSYILRIDEVCSLLQISRSTFWRWRRYDNFPKPTVKSRGGKKWKFSDIEAWLDTNNFESIEY